MNWDSLIKILTAGKIIPVIGNDLIRMKDKDGTLVPLYRHIARELTRTLKMDFTGQCIGELALAFPNENVIQTAESIFKGMSAESFNLKLLEKLTRIRDFNFFISTTHDGLLVKALCTSRGLDPDQVEGYTQGNVQRFIDKLYDEWVAAKKELPPGMDFGARPIYGPYDHFKLLFICIIRLYG